jgi:esterase/lipase
MTIKLFRLRSMSPSIIGQERPDAAVLFVHGLGGSYWTWNKFSVHLEAEWKEADSFGLEYDEFYQNQGFFYTTPVLRSFTKLWKIFTGPGIENLSDHLRTVIKEVCDEYENVIIVAHSMGGLVARKYIVNELQETKTVGKVKALITYATPHQGSIWSNYFMIACNFMFFILNYSPKTKQISQLSKNNSFINQLNTSWSNLRVEDKIDFKRVVGLVDWVVDIESSSFKNDPNVSAIANKNHFTIIKPVRHKDPAFMVTYNYLKRFRLNMEQKTEREEETEFLENDLE